MGLALGMFLIFGAFQAQECWKYWGAPGDILWFGRGLKDAAHTLLDIAGVLIIGAGLLGKFK